MPLIASYFYIDITLRYVLETRKYSKRFIFLNWPFINITWELIAIKHIKERLIPENQFWIIWEVVFWSPEMLVVLTEGQPSWKTLGMLQNKLNPSAQTCTYMCSFSLCLSTKALKYTFPNIISLTKARLLSGEKKSFGIKWPNLWKTEKILYGPKEKSFSVLYGDSQVWFCRIHGSVDKALTLMKGRTINLFAFYRHNYERKPKSYAQATTTTKKKWRKYPQLPINTILLVVVFFSSFYISLYFFSSSTYVVEQTLIVE